MNSRDLLFDALHKYIDEVRLNPKPDYSDVWEKLTVLFKAVDILDKLGL